MEMDKLFQWCVPEWDKINYIIRRTSERLPEMPVLVGPIPEQKLTVHCALHSCSRPIP